MKTGVIVSLCVLLVMVTTVYAENQTDPCDGVVCSQPSTITCVGNDIVTTYYTGTCADGTCSFTEQQSSTPCHVMTEVCPDGYQASCDRTCSTTGSGASCSDCTPSCAGHETAAVTECETGQEEMGTCANGMTYLKKKCENGFWVDNVAFWDGEKYTNSPCQDQTNFCDTAYCGTFDGTCPDGTPASCPKICDEASRSCLDCQFDCTGHTVCTEGEIEHHMCTDGTQYAKLECTGGTWVEINYVDNPCGTCPVLDCAPPPDNCRIEPKWENGCETCGEVVCDQTPGPCPMIHCEVPEGCWAEHRYDQNGCQVCGEVRCDNQACPPDCVCERDSQGNMYKKYCKDKADCNNNGICEAGEEYGCNDCIGGEDCPVTKKCSDGNQIMCHQTEFGCRCDPCPLPEKDIPYGCKQVTDDRGFVKVICDNSGVECPDVPQDVRMRCVDEGGTPMFNKDHSGCNRFRCDFGGGQGRSFVPQAGFQGVCPSPEEVLRSLEKCSELGLPGFVSFENGCKIGVCADHDQGAGCEYFSNEDWERKKAECNADNRNAIDAYDENGCKYPICGDQFHCMRELPKGAYDNCNKRGGELVVRHTDIGCIEFSQCVTRGDHRNVYVEEFRGEAPGSTDLLAVAFKLEELRQELDKLSRKADELAKYYNSVGSDEANRFRRVADMFASATERVDEIRSKIRSNVDDMTPDMALEIKQDLRYLKEVMIKDILYVMLSSDEEINDIKSDKVKNCGRDDECFDRAFRVCQPLTFKPDDHGGPIVEVTGLEGDKCVMVVKQEGDLPPGVTGPLQMVCKIERYSYGVRNPEEDIFPYCEGNLLEMMKKYGTEPRGVPGECEGDNCREYCGRGPEEARKCLEHMGDIMPDDVRDDLERISRGEMPRGPPRDEYRDDYPKDDYRGDYGDEPYRSDYPKDDYPKDDYSGSCSGCLDNGVCDPGECRDCRDCGGI